MDVLVQESHSENLLVYLYKLYQGRTLCDMYIESCDGMVFSSHRLILASTSTFIHQMIMSNPALTSLKLDVKSNILQMLLEFGYTGQLFVADHLRQDLKSAATVLQMYSVLELLKYHSAAEDLDYEEVPDDGGAMSTNDSTSKNDNFWSSDNKDSPTDGADLDFPDACPVEQNSSSSSKCRKSMDSVVEEEVTEKTKEKSKGKKSKKRSKRLMKKESSLTNDSRDDPVFNEVQVTTRSKKWKKKASTLEDVIYSCITKGSGKKSQLQKYMKKVKRNAEKSRKERKKKRQTRKLYVATKEEKMKNMAVKCRYCMKKILIHQLHQHMSENHMETFLKQLYSCFLINRSLKSKMGTSYSYWQNGSKNLISCNFCSKKYTKYSLFALHYKRDHSYQERNGWLRFISLRSQKMIKLSKRLHQKVPKIKLRIPKKKTLKCELCNKWYVSKLGLALHMKRLHGKGKKSDTRQKEQLPPSSFACYLCHKNLLSEAGLRKHLETIHSQPVVEAKRNLYELAEVLKCEVATCQFSSSNILDMNQHVIALHPYIQHSCSMCRAVFKVRLMLERHIASKHSVKKKAKIQCSACGQTFIRASSLRRHEFFKHGVEHKNVRVYRCEHEQCDYVTSCKSSLKSHQSKHETEKKFTCEFCGMKLKTEVSHKKHINKMHLGVRPYLCQVCGQSFGEDHELKSHFTNRHSTEREFKCKYCNYATSVKNTYFTHVFNVHKVRDEDDKRKEYVCTLCPFKSILHHRFKVHMNSHTNQRDYKCKVCYKTFISSSTLLTHMKWVHTESLFPCTQCDYQTKTRQKLNEHIRVQHQLKGFKPYKCPYCDFRCATGGNTRKHVKQVHRGREVTYLRDEHMLEAARRARQVGHHAQLVFINKPDNYSSNAGDGSMLGKGYPPGMTQPMMGLQNQRHMME